MLLVKAGLTEHGRAEEDLEFRKLSRSISLQIHKINSNTAAINRLVELLGSNKDGKELRTKLRNLLEVTRDVLKDSTQDLQRFTHWQLQPGDVRPFVPPCFFTCRSKAQRAERATEKPQARD